MRDLINTLRGKRHCPWCVGMEAPTTWWERLMRFDQLVRTSERPWWERAAMRLGACTDAGPLSWPWRIARLLHFRFHETAERRAEYWGKS